ncbi:COG4280 domain-containing protein [Microtetraspora malaysiensis]|uniref:COG4280 domain-containing protein n=1 Tax=Microtetraspora malaysiensis TaxID=161358 RepID=UPI000837588F|nr:TMEM165/GDT1 family protein [Microtetraspora malaysiensis]
MTGATWGLVASTFAASFVEFVEALTIVLAMGVTRGWRSALAGTLVALVALTAFTAAAGYALSTWLPEALLQLVVGTLLLIFGLQWLRKAVLRSSGLKAMHDEDEEFASQTEAGRKAAAKSRFGIDTFAFVVSFKGVFLEGVEVVFIVITFGLSAANMPAAIGGAAVAGLLVLIAGLILHRPLAMIPENALKYGVGLLLASFGAYWAVEGLGVFTESGESLEWPGHDWAILALIAGWLLISRVLVTFLPRLKPEVAR